MPEIKKISIEEEGYPKLLKEIKKAPKIIYYSGNLKAEENCIAIVGSRICSAYGKQAAYDIAGNLARAGLTIVSGLAPGIDTIAHQATLDAKGRTIAVLGTGIDEQSLYPRENILLARKIVATGGCVVSEYPPGTIGARYTFPERNRIISGLSLGTVVVEAKEKSGALITAAYANFHKRKLFAVPGPIYSETSRGTNNLIKNGVKSVDKAEDILKELGLVVQKTDFTEEKAVSLGSPEEKIILDCLKENSLHIDEIIRKTGLKSNLAASTVGYMEMEEKIINLGGNIYALKR